MFVVLVKLFLGCILTTAKHEVRANSVCEGTASRVVSCTASPWSQVMQGLLPNRHWIGHLHPIDVDYLLNLSILSFNDGSAKWMWTANRASYAQWATATATAFTMTRIFLELKGYRKLWMQFEPNVSVADIANHNCATAVAFSYQTGSVPEPGDSWA